MAVIRVDVPCFVVLAVVIAVHEFARAGLKRFDPFDTFRIKSDGVSEDALEESLLDGIGSVRRFGVR
jgi:hypothetical protein